MTAAELIERLKEVPPNTLVVRPAGSMESGYYQHVEFTGPSEVRPSNRVKGLFTTTDNKRRRRKAVVLR